MWIFLNNAFLSIVAPTPDSDAAKCDMLVVRARIKGDIEAVFPDVRVWEDKKYVRDYRYRAVVDRATVMAAMVKAVNNLDYTNFKDSTGPASHRRHMLYMRVWSVMFNAQESRRPARPKKKGARPSDIGAPYGSSIDDGGFDPNFNSLTGLWKQ